MKAAGRHDRFPHPGPLPEGEGDKEHLRRDFHGNPPPRGGRGPRGEGANNQRLRFLGPPAAGGGLNGYVVRIVIGSQGDLVALRLVNSSGSDELDRAAEQIVRQTAPFPPVPAELEKHTSRLKLIINMRFEGSKNLVPE